MRLWLKFLLASAIVILLCLIVAGLLASGLIRRQFDRFVQTPQQRILQAVAPFLADYYATHESWDGLERWLLERRGPGNMGMGMGVRGGMRLLILDGDRRVVVDSQGQATGQTVPQTIWNAGVPIQVNGQEVGRLISEAALLEARQRTQEERAFLRSIGWALAGASLVGGLAAIVVATVLALQLTAPARQLTRAARKIATGDLSQRVAIRSQDELAEVGQAFNEMAASLAQQEELRRQMVADIAHELRTPLTVMQVELSAIEDGLCEPTPETVASLGEEVRLLTRLVEDLRLLSLMDAGRLHLQIEPLPPARVVQQAVQRIATTAEEKGISLHTAASEDLPPLLADPDRLQQVLLNLLQNALRHTPAGGQIEVAAQAGGGGVHLAVRDTGEGIPPEDLPHIFDRFYRADTSRSRETGGSGLGLTIARGLVEAMGGRIWAESTPGRGTTVHLTLPRATG